MKETKGYWRSRTQVYCVACEKLMHRDGHQNDERWYRCPSCKGRCNQEDVIKREQHTESKSMPAKKR
jgi:hypothetical protein